jgi:hypothetical protein
MNQSIKLSVEGLRAGKARNEFLAVFCRPGRIRRAGGQAGNMVVSAEALASAQERLLFDGRPVFLDHDWMGGRLENIVGQTTTAELGEDGEIIGRILMYDTEKGNNIASLLVDVLDQAEKIDIGLSLVFWPETAPEGDDIIITGIRHVESVDLVFEPATDSRILQKLGVVRPETIEMEEYMESVPEEVRVPENAGDGWLQALSATVASAMINASTLPAPSKARLLSQSFQDATAVQAAIDGEVTYLSELRVGESPINIGGQAPRARLGGMIDSMDQITEAFEALLLGRRPANAAPLTGIRELYTLLSGDYEMAGMFHADRVMFASVNSSTMAQLVANVLNKRVANEFIQYPQWWLPLVMEEDFTSLQAIRWITLGGVGELPTVAEGAAYTELTWDDSYETASFAKKGGYLGLTIEAIDKDDTGRLRAAPRALAQAAWLTLSKAISEIFTSNAGVGPTLIDTGALFNSTAVTSAGGHANLGTTALSITTWTAARLAMRKQVELNSSERLGALTAPKYLLVPPDLEVTALQVLGSQADYLYALSNGQAAPTNVFAEGDQRQAILEAARRRVIVMDLWTDTNNWAAVADPMLWPTIGVGYRYGRTPEVFSVASPTSGLMFSNDTMPVKVRFFFATGPKDFRGLYKANVA